MEIITLIGLFAAICTTISSLPQLLKAIKTKHTKDLSPTMYLLLTAGISAWLIYGIMIKDLPLVFANSATLIFTIMILTLIFKYNTQKTFKFLIL
jgi:MtN3 and saliva related transmembrane protein